ncbi:MAG: hypothetical protein ACOYK1_00060 [Vampirovibrionia bacterium]
MNLQVLGSSDDGLRMNSRGVIPVQGVESSASFEIASQSKASSKRPPDIIEISTPLDEINDLQHVRKDLHFPVTIDESLFTEIMHPKSQEDLEKYLPWRYLVRDIFQPKPVIVEDTNEELERINSRSRKDVDPIREQRYWQNQIFLRYAVEEGLSEGRHGKDLKSWLEDLHKIACSGLDGHNHYYDWNEENAEFSSRDEGLMTRYQNKSPEEIEDYLNKFKQFLQLGIPREGNKQDLLDDFAKKYVDVIVYPPFERVNNSLVMNILNLMLTKQGMHQISHGNLDQSLCDCKRWDSDWRLQRAIGEFPRSIFLRAILQTNPRLEKDLRSLLKTPDGFAEKYERYLEKLSKLDSSGVLSSETYHLMEYLSVSDLGKKCETFQEVIKITDLLKKGAQKGVFTEKLLTNHLEDIRKAFDNLNLNVDSLQRQKNLLLLSLGLKSRYPNFDTHVPTLKELVSNCMRELALQNMDGFQHPRLCKEGRDFLDNTDPLM